jgi:hypothetical protein
VHRHRQSTTFLFETHLTSEVSSQTKSRKPESLPLFLSPLVEASLTRTPCDPTAVATALKGFTAHCNFKSLVNHAAERRAAQIYADLLVSQHEMRMAEFETSLHSDAISEEQSFYNALAQLQIYKYERMMRNFKMR